jgi:regulatory protein
MSRSKKAPPKPSKRYVNWAIMAYLQRYSGPRVHVRRVLWRKLTRCIDHHDGDRDEVSGWIEEALDQAEQSGLINDDRYVADKVRSYLRRGASERGIAHKLRAKGIASEKVQAAIATLSEEGFDPTAISAAAFVRRGRMGAFRVKEMDPFEARRKDMGRLARAGFSMDVARKMLEMDRDEIEDLAFQRRFI